MQIVVMNLLACPGCSMLRLDSPLFREPTHARWAMLIVLGALAIPAVLFAAGMRLGEPRRVRSGAVWGLTALLLGGWILALSGGPGGPNFAFFLMHWIYLPLVLVFDELVWVAWEFPPVNYISVLLLPALGCYYGSRLVLTHDRKLTWKRHGDSTPQEPQIESPTTSDSLTGDQAVPVAALATASTAGAPSPVVLGYQGPGLQATRRRLRPADASAVFAATNFGALAAAIVVWLPARPDQYASAMIPAALLAGVLCGVFTLTRRVRTAREAGDQAAVQRIEPAI